MIATTNLVLLVVFMTVVVAYAANLVCQLPVIFVSIRWNDQWCRDHARGEFQTEQFSLGILRTSWLAKLLFEWTEKKETSLPAELIASFAKGLFDTSVANPSLHLADDLAALLKHVSSFKLSKEGIEVTRAEPK